MSKSQRDRSKSPAASVTTLTSGLSPSAYSKLELGMDQRKKAVHQKNEIGNRNGLTKDDPSNRKLKLESGMD